MDQNPFVAAVQQREFYQNRNANENNHPSRYGGSDSGYNGSRWNDSSSQQNQGCNNGGQNGQQSQQNDAKGSGKVGGKSFLPHKISVPRELVRD